ncbi:hypothetical protein D3C80_1139640 [compost metagenome]
MHIGNNGSGLGFIHLARVYGSNLKLNLQFLRKRLAPVQFKYGFSIKFMIIVLIQHFVMSAHPPGSRQITSGLGIQNPAAADVVDLLVCFRCSSIQNENLILICCYCVQCYPVALSFSTFVDQLDVVIADC